ncbi:MAG: lipoyl(octanoyl) transferase LipB [Rikenellaceae bacterium]
MRSIRLEDKGVVDYKEAWDAQSVHFNKIQEGCGEDVLMICEHPHVYTLGKNGYRENMLVSDSFLESIGATYYKVDRGGDITYHGYGQIVGYPIINLSNFSLNLKGYINILEEAVIKTVLRFGIKCERLEGATGVWYRGGDVDRKICAIGVKASRFVTMHGFALNVNTNLDYFRHINPCGFVEKGVTSLRELTGGHEIDMNEVKTVFCNEFSSLLGAEIKK